MLKYFNLYCKRYVIPYSARLYCTLYMFCIGLMMAVFTAETCSPDVIDISSMR